FHGQVIDMLFFPLFDFVWPNFVPYVGGEEFLFFSPVFNIADSSIFVGVATILLWQKKFFPEAHKLTEDEEEQKAAAEFSESTQTEIISINSHEINSQEPSQNGLSEYSPVEKKDGTNNSI